MNLNSGISGKEALVSEVRFLAYKDFIKSYIQRC